MIELQSLGTVNRHDLHRWTATDGGPTRRRLGLRVQFGEQPVEILRTSPFARGHSIPEREKECARVTQLFRRIGIRGPQAPPGGFQPVRQWPRAVLRVSLRQSGGHSLQTSPIGGRTARQTGRVGHRFPHQLPIASL